MNQADKIKLNLRIAIVSGAFTIMVCILMLLNFWQLQSTDPLESELMANLVEQLSQDPRNETLKEDIRRLDLMTRKAYFTKQWQIRAGAGLLLGGAIVMIFALRNYQSLTSKLNVPVSGTLNQELALLTSRKWILYSILGLFCISLVAAYTSDDHLSEFYAITESVETPQEPAIQEVTIRKASDEPERPVTETPPEKDKGAEAQEEQTTNASEMPAEASTSDETETETIPAAVPEARPAFPTQAQIMNQFPSFRGPFGLGISHHQNIPIDWDGPSGKNILWKVPIQSPGYNSPVIWNDRLFLTGAEGSEEFVYCYNSKSGELLWQYHLENIPGSTGKIPNVTEDTGLAAPTATTDGTHVYAIFATGDLVCLDNTGQRVWAKNLGIPDNHYGHSSSLIMWEGLLIVQYDTNKEGEVMAFDANTGDERWRTKRGTKISWASPILAPIGDRYEIVLTSAPLVAAYDPSTGQELWGVECLMGEVGASAGYGDGIVFAANEYASLVAIRPGAEPEILWESNEYLPEVASPVAANGMLFVGTSYGVFACFDASNGEILWEYEADQGFYASPMIAENKVYALDMDGKMHIFNLAKEMKLVGTPELGETTVCTPAFAKGKIFLRTSENLYCIGK